MPGPKLMTASFSAAAGSLVNSPANNLRAVVDRHLVRQRLIIARADRVDLPGRVAARELGAPGPEGRPLSE
jgi:hypothetical protein